MNVRTFKPDVTKGNPFDYGLRDANEVTSRVLSFTHDGYYVIVNETIDVSDGGVSGVRGGGITEFAPGGTPRIVEEPDVCSVDNNTADAILDTVYDVAPRFPKDPELRVEFSVHPVAVGYRHDRWIVWEVTRVPSLDLRPHLHWPNRFSSLIGDKAFGLLMAHVAGLPVPKTLVLARDVAPFEFGAATGADDRWVRTCPRHFSPGQYPTIHGWADPFKLLCECDPDGAAVASVLVQQGVDAHWRVPPVRPRVRSRSKVSRRWGRFS